MMQDFHPFMMKSSLKAVAKDHQSDDFDSIHTSSFKSDDMQGFAKGKYLEKKQEILQEYKDSFF